MSTSNADASGPELTREQIEVFASGLYQIAVCDGVDGREVEIVEEFLRDTGASELVAQLSKLDFDPARAYRVLETSWLRSLFLRAALLVVRADGVVSEPERETVKWIADAFGIAGGYDGLVDQLEGQSL